MNHSNRQIIPFGGEIITAQVKIPCKTKAAVVRLL